MRQAHQISIVFLFIVSVFCNSAFSEESMTLHWLGGLPASVIDEIAKGYTPEILEAYQHQQVNIRGFVYQTKDGNIVLAAEPNLKSCCVGSQRNITRQIILIGSGLEVANDNRPKEIQGRFETKPLKDENGQLKQLFVLYDAAIVNYNNNDHWLVYFIIGIVPIIILWAKWTKWTKWT